ncbi:MAG: HIT family protein [Nitrospirota bacterium]|nr:HIT family protein [Nitrospirota bacterium]
MFQLDPRLASDCVQIGRFPLSLLLLMNDSRFPWCILVPEREGVSEIFQLPEPDRVQLMGEISHLSEVMHQVFGAHKINVASLGNVIPPLHVHVVVRKPGDATWPGPVWGSFPPVPYTPDQLETTRHDLLSALGERARPTP